MKTIIVIACVVLSIECSAHHTGAGLLAVPTQTRVTKTCGGLRGFKTVTEDVKPGVYANLACANPGTNKCAFKKPPQLVLTDLSSADLEEIDQQINVHVGQGNFTGSFTFTSNTSGQYLVIFEANAGLGRIEYTIYTPQEATEHGYRMEP